MPLWWKHLRAAVRPGQRCEEAEMESGTRSQRGCCGGAPEKEDGEAAAYRHLLDVLEQAEDTRWSRSTVFVVALEMVVVLGLTAALACTLKLERMKHSRLRGLRMWQYVMMAIAVFAGLSIVRFITKVVFWAVMACRWRLHRDLGYFLREMKTSIDVTLWFCCVLSLWYVWFRPRLRHVYGELSVVAAHQVTRFLIAACLGAALWVGKNALFTWLEADLLYRKLCERITRTIRQLHVLQILHNFGVWRFLTHVKHKRRLQQLLDPRHQEEIKKDQTKLQEEMKKLRKEGDNICKELLLVNKERVPVWILRRLCEEYTNQVRTKPGRLPVDKEFVQDPEKLMEQAFNLFREMKGPKKDGQQSLPTICDDDEVNLADMKGRYEVDLEDVKLFFKSISGEKLDITIKKRQNDEKNRRCGFFSLVSATCEKCCCSGKNKTKEVKEDSHMANSPKTEEHDCRVGRDEFLSWAVVAYRNCWGLQSTLKSSEQIILKLNRMMIVFVLILALILWLLLSEIVDSAQIALLFSPLLAAKFIFSESTKNMFDGLIFALAMHPFSPGDRVIIKGMELLVTEINILTTTFYKYQTGEELVYPNSELATIEIINLENNPDQSDHLEFLIKKSIPLEDIKDLEIQIQVSLNERVDAFKTKVVMTEMGLEDIKMIAHFNYVGSYLTSQVKAVHRSEMLSTIMHLQKKMEATSNKVDSFTFKPYIVDVTLSKRVKVKHLDTIKTAVTESLKDEYKDNDLKVVLNCVTDKKVRMIFYVWNKEQQELIAVEKLDSIRSCILRRIRSTQNDGHLQDKSDDEGQLRASSRSSLQVTQVKLQPTLGIAEITVDSNVDETKVKVMENAIQRYFCGQCYPYEFEVKINKEKNVLEIHAWMQFPHNIEEEKQQLDMEQIMCDNLKKIAELEELKENLKIVRIVRRHQPEGIA